MIDAAEQTNQHHTWRKFIECLTNYHSRCQNACRSRQEKTRVSRSNGKSRFESIGKDQPPKLQLPSDNSELGVEGMLLFKDCTIKHLKRLSLIENNIQDAGMRYLCAMRLDSLA